MRITVLDEERKGLSSEAEKGHFRRNAFKESGKVQKEKFAEEHFLFLESKQILDIKGKKLRLVVGRGMETPHLPLASRIFFGFECRTYAGITGGQEEKTSSHSPVALVKNLVIRNYQLIFFILILLKDFLEKVKEIRAVRLQPSKVQVCTGWIF